MVLGVPMHNELSKGHLHLQLENALAIGYDEIVILDDSSTDGSWEALEEYRKNYDNIHLINNKHNSILSKGVNRWKVVIEKCAEFKPDWINVRAGDHTYSYPAFKDGPNMFRSQLEKFFDEGINLVHLKQLHLWRSDWWYRIDSRWGGRKYLYCDFIWRYNKKFRFHRHIKSQMHIKMYIPDKLGFKKVRKAPINRGLGDSHIVIFHHGMSTHEKIVNKFKWYMTAASRVPAICPNMPSPKKGRMPGPNGWKRLAGYGVLHEFGIKLKKVRNIWFKDDVPKDVKPPKIESLSEIIKEYSPRIARQYQDLYDKKIKGKVFHYHDDQTVSLSPNIE